MIGHHPYSPISPTDGSLHPDSDHLSQDSRETIELRNQRPGQPAALAQNSQNRESLPPPNPKVFKSNQQSWKLFFPQFFRWLGTVVFIAFILTNLKLFENAGNFSSRSKHLFNTIVTALSLGLGVNFFEAFKDIAKVVRWRILASRKHSVREVDLILSIESLSKIVELAWVGRKRLLVVLSCVSWLALNLAAQAAVALIGLTYSVDSGTDWRGTYTSRGTVNATDLTCFGDHYNCPIYPRVEQSRAHLYGEIASGPPCQPYNHISEVLDSDSGASFYCNQASNQQEYALRFSVINPDDGRRIYPRFTNRIITASSGQCYQYNITDGSNETALDPNGDDAVRWAYSNGTINGTITIPTAYSGEDSTTYIYPGSQMPQNETEYSCGPRCMWMWAWRSISTLPQDKGEARALIKCPITVSSVTNVTDDSQRVSDGIAKLAASAIGLTGRSADDNGTTTWRQYQFYPWGSPWEIHRHQLDEVGANMAYFALGSLSWMATNNPTYSTEGLVPILGFSLSVHWNYVIAVCVCIVVVHFAFIVTAVYTSRLVIIKDDTFLSAARLLRPLVEHLGPRATFLEGKELSEAIEEFVPKGVVYGPRNDEALGGRALDLGEGVLPRRELIRRRHPNGEYL